MTNDRARKHLRKLLRSHTNGAILHLLAELTVEEAVEARRNGNDLLCKRLELVEAGLIVLGYGVDAACPDDFAKPARLLRESHSTNGEANHD